MSDELTIYISPDDDLTTVRERLEEISARRLTMVIPPQTQLRSHVAWKLLYARARELGKEVVIVSSDPQVRSVAHAVKFKVAYSLETPSATGKSRPGSRSARTTSSGGAKLGHLLLYLHVLHQPKMQVIHVVQYTVGEEHPTHVPHALVHLRLNGMEIHNIANKQKTLLLGVLARCLLMPPRQKNIVNRTNFASKLLLLFIPSLIRSKNQICYWRITHRHRISAWQLARVKNAFQKLA